MQEKVGSLLDCKEDYIVHQCNCVTTESKGLAKDIFTKFPFANVYLRRTKTCRDVPGTIGICGDGENRRFVINLFGQYYPGGPQSYETSEQRAKWFKQCLLEMEKKIPRDASIAFPYQIGCGLAKGDWSVYRKMIEEFSLKRIDCKVTIYQTP